MDWLTRILMSIDAIKSQWWTLNKKNIDDYYELVSPINDYTFKMNDGSMLSFFSIKGFSQILSDAEKLNNSGKIANELSYFFKHKGYSLQFVDCADPDLTERKVRKSIKPSIDELKNIGLTSDLFTSSYIKFIVNKSVWKEQYVVIKTNSLSLSNNSDKKNTSQEVKNKNLIKSTFVLDIQKDKFNEQSLFLSDQEKEILGNHNAFRQVLLKGLKKNGSLIDELNVVEALKAQKESIYGVCSPQNWQPSLGQLFIERKNQHISMDEVKVNDTKIVEQVITSGISEEDMPAEILKLGDRYLTTISLVLPQSNSKKLRSYEYLLCRIPKEVGYVFSMSLESDPFSTSKYKTESVFTSLSLIYPMTDNMLIKRARDSIKERHKEDVELSVFMSLSITLHAKDIETLQTNKRILYGLLEGWGSAKFRNVELNKTQGVFDTFPGCAKKSNLKQVLESLPCALYQSPLYMDGIAYDSGYLHFYTELGTPYPFEEQSSKNINFNSYFCGESGSGKSTLLSLFNLALIAKPKTNPKLKGELPLQFNVDFGKTSFSLNETLRLFIGKEKEHFFYSHEMTTDKESAYNVHDLPFGRNKPTMRHKAVIVRFLSVLICGINQHKGGYTLNNACIEEMIKYLVDIVYEHLSDDNEPRIYESAEFRDRDTLKYLHSLGIDPNRKSYYRLSDLIMEKDPKKGVRHAIRLRRYAMPRLSDYTTLLSIRTEISKRYKEQILPDNQTWFDFFVRRVADVINEYPCFNRVTKLNIDLARLISIDIKNVCGDSVYRKAIFGSLMLLMFLVKKENTEESPDLFNEVSKSYLPYLKRFDAINRFLPGTLNIEEAHVLMTLFEDVLNENQRQNRKGNWGIRSLSQRLIDPSDEFFSLCSTVFIASNEASDHNKPRFREMNLSNREKTIVSNELTGKITDFFAYIKTKNVGKASGPKRIAIKLQAIFPSGFIWATNSDPIDRQFKMIVMKKFGAIKGFSLLECYFPEGKVKHYFDSNKIKRFAESQGFNDLHDYFISEMEKRDKPSNELCLLLVN